MFENIRGAIFDVDGTILDSLPVWEIVPALYLKKLGVNAKPELPKQVFHMTFEEGAAFIKKEYELSETEDEIKNGILQTADERYKNFIPAKPQTLKVIKDFFEKGIRMTVATSASRHHVETAFKRLGIFEYFDGIFCSSEIGTSKSDPKIFLMAAEKMGTTLEETCVFEDALFAIETARNAGFKTCGVYDEFSRDAWENMCRETDWFLK